MLTQTLAATNRPSADYGDWRKSYAYYLPTTRSLGLDDSAAELLAKVKRHGFSSDRGCLLGGCVGNGKTTRLKLVARTLYVAYIDARTISGELAGRLPSDDRFRDLCNLQQFGNIYGDKWHLAHDLIIDDLGTESATQSSYGNRSDVMATIIDARYDEWRYRGWRTYIATNLGSDTLRKVYGERTYSRLREMCEFIRLQGGDRRAAR